MRVGDYIYREGGFSFYLEYDTGGDPDYPWTVWIYKDKKPYLYRESDFQIRREFRKKTHKAHIMNFCKKFVRDEGYREKYLNEYLNDRTISL